MSTEQGHLIGLPEAQRMQNKVIGLGFVREFYCPENGDVLFQEDVIYGNPAVRDERLVGEEDIAGLKGMVGESIVWLGDFGEATYDFVPSGDVKIISKIFASDRESAYLGTDVVPDSDGLMLMLNMRFTDHENRRVVRFCVDSEDTFSFRMSYFDDEERSLAYQSVTDVTKKDQKVPISQMTKEELVVIMYYLKATREYFDQHI